MDAETPPQTVADIAHLPCGSQEQFTASVPPDFEPQQLTQPGNDLVLLKPPKIREGREGRERSPDERVYDYRESV